jgi:CheY-like chemotaxis protein
VTARVLVVEDDQDVARSIDLTIAREGIQIEHAASGLEGLARVKTLKPDLVLLDVQLPHMDGFEVFQRMRKDPELRGIRTIFLSAHAPRGAFDMLLELGAFACFTKPFEPEELREQVARALGLSAEGADRSSAGPAAPPQHHHAPPASETADIQPGSPTESRPRGSTIALIDADLGLFGSVVAIAREALGAGTVVHQFASARDAARDLPERAPDLILLDLKLPDVDGVSALTGMKRDAKLCDVPVIVMTTDANWGMLARALDAGAEAYVPKPIERVLLTSLMRQLRRDSGGAPRVTDVEAQGLKRGTVLATRYVVRDILGTGGMGAVYRVHDRLRETEVALKVMLPSRLSKRKNVERFRREAEITLRLSHPGIVRVFDVGEDRERMLRFFTMELLEGVSLRRWLDRRREGGAIVAVEEAITIAKQVLEALIYAHKTTIHRDLKPENIFLLHGSIRDLKLLDFGIAKLQTDQFTSTAIGIGTAYYMAPEQQIDAGSVDGRADLYSLSVVLYEMLCGKLPVGRFELPGTLRKLPPGLEAIILDGLSTKPQGRPATAWGMMERLREIEVRG